MTSLARIGFAVLVTSALVAWIGGWASSQAQTPQAGAPSAQRGRTPRLPDPPYRYTDVELPRHFTAAAAMRFDNTPPENPLTDHGATLGRVLFYDTRLSANNTVSCGSCHAQARAFDDPERFSRGFKGGRTDRHAMNLVNLRYHPRGRFFWDERGGNLEDMVLLPVQNTLEMGQEVAQLPAILAREPFYPRSSAPPLATPPLPRPVLRERSPSSFARWCRTNPATTRAWRALPPPPTTLPASRCRRTGAKRCSGAIARSATCRISRTRTS